MTEVIIAHEKHGTFTYSSARALLESRVNDGYWYNNWDDGNPKHQWADLADAALINETSAWHFLESRQDHEYEYVEIQEIQ